MIDYSKGKIYKIVCNITGLIYIGSTCEPTLARRLTGHIKNYKRWKREEENFVSCFKILENNNYDIILIEDYPCERKDQLHARERHYIQTIVCVNKVIPTRSIKEYRIDHKSKISDAWKNYYEENKATLKVKNKIRRDQNIDKIKELKKERNSMKHICCCGHKYTIDHKSRHEATKIHQDYMKSQEV
jgi:hypothetical protein